MSNTLDQSGFAMPQAFFGSLQLQCKLLGILHTKVFQFASLEQIPYPFLRIQFRRIPWQALQMNAFGSPCAQKVFDDMTAMNRSPIPNDQQFARDFAQKQLQKAYDISPFVRMILDLHEQSSRERQPSHCRKVIASQWNGQDGGLTHWRIRAYSHRQQVKRRLVYKDDGTLFFLRLFFNSATRCSRQVWIAWASRWLARLSGFWTLCLIALRRRLQWVG